MRNTNQTDNQTVWEHGVSVWNYTQRLITKDFDGMKIPEWFERYHFQIVNGMHDLSLVEQYNIYHDCGKPYCIQIDHDGIRHFPNHAEVSTSKWLLHNPESTIVASLIRNDMMFHTATADYIENFTLNNPTKTTLTLLVTALAELHANAEMFGGIESTSFKIKWKKINQRGKQIMKTVFANADDRYFCYIIVRNDMEKRHATVQGTHAAIEQARRNPGEVHPSVIYVSVKNQSKLKKVAKDLIEQGIEFTSFTENFGLHENQMTAICTEAIADLDAKRDFMKKFQLFS